jgi:acetoacetate decarboxylase
VIPVRSEGQAGGYVHAMYLDDEAPIAGGRELWDVTVKGAWSGPAALQLFHHALAPVAQLPVLEIVSGVHIVSDLTLGLGTVVHDYLR